MAKSVRFSKIQLATMGAFIGLALFNPLSVEVLDQYFKWAYAAITVLCAAWVVGFTLYQCFRPQSVKVPSKTKKQQVKPSQYLEA